MAMCREARMASMALRTMGWTRATRRLMSTEVGRVRGEVVLHLMVLRRTGRTAGLRKSIHPTASLLDVKHCVGVKVLVA